MKIYIRTRWNPNSDGGFYWQMIDTNDKSNQTILKEPEVLKKLNDVDINLSDISQSIVLWSNEKGFCSLLIDNIESGYLDKANRPIKHAFVFEIDSKNENLLRNILLLFLDSIKIKENTFTSYFLSYQDNCFKMLSYKPKDNSSLGNNVNNNDWQNIKNLNELKEYLTLNKLIIPKKYLVFFADTMILFIRKDISEVFIKKIKEKNKCCCVLSLN